MHIATDIGRRLELISMDPHFFEISIGLYVRDTPDGPVGVVHSYSTRPGAGERLAFVTQGMRVLGGVEPVGSEELAMRFPCRTWHTAAGKRLFLEACKLDPASAVGPRPLETPDPRSEQSIRVESLADGSYRVHADGATEETPSRAPAIASALVKLGELTAADGDPAVVTFPCRHAHDVLLGTLLPRALNLRQALREEELNATRGVLAAPSAQQ